MTWSAVGTPTGFGGYDTTPDAIPLPSGYATGDLLIIFGGAVNPAHQFAGTVPTGWTLLWSNNAGAFAGADKIVLGRIATGSDSSPVFGTPITGGSADVFASVAFRDDAGVVSLDSIVAHINDDSSTGDTTIPYPGAVASTEITEDNCLILLLAHAQFGATGGADTSSFNTESGFTEHGEYVYQVNYGGMAGIQYQVQTTATTISAGTIETTGYTATSTNQRGGILVLLSGESAFAFDETLKPNAVSLTNLTGAYTDIDDDVDSPDANWLTAI